MNKKILLPIFILVLALMPLGSAHAAPPDLDVQFENTPLFSEANFAPGNTVTRFVKVTNTTNGQKPVQAEAINVADGDALSSQIDFQITEGATTIFDGTLKEFFDKHESPLTNIAGNSTTTYNFSATFNPQAGNSYQNKTVSFDLLVGFQGQVQGGGGGGGGGAAPVQGLAIIENTVVPSPQGSGAVQVNWSTTAASTSRVVYSAANEPHVLSLTDPNQGYAHSSPEISALVVNHNLALTGLLPNTTYFYRVLSHDTTQALSLEHSFTTTGTGTVAGISTGNPNNPTPPGKAIGLGKAVIKTGKVLGESIVNPLEPDTASASGTNTPNEPTIPNSNSSPVKLWIIIAIVILSLGIVYFVFYGRNGR